MIAFAPQGLLLDIEGTTSSIRFVVDVLFPYARAELRGHLRARWNTPPLARALELLAQDAGHAAFADWRRAAGAASDDAARELVAAETLRLMDGDVKATGLKELQGQIWEGGFTTGRLRAHVYPDVPPALTAWRQAERDTRIYSSGSVAAQKLFFAHTEAGDLLDCFRGHYDTTTGGKKESASYARVARDFGLPAGDILFVSDVVAEIDAARAAGMRTALCARPGNAPAPPGHGHDVITSFAEIAWRD